MRYTLVNDETGEVLYLFGHILTHGFQMYVRNRPDDDFEYILHEGQSRDDLIYDEEVPFKESISGIELV